MEKFYQEIYEIVNKEIAKHVDRMRELKDGCIVKLKNRENPVTIGYGGYRPSFLRNGSDKGKPYVAYFLKMDKRIEVEEILGCPATLCDVIQWINAKFTSVNISKMEQLFNEHDREHHIKTIVVNWNTQYDELKNQSEDIIKYLYSII